MATKKEKELQESIDALTLELEQLKQLTPADLTEVPGLRHQLTAALDTNEHLAADLDLCEDELRKARESLASRALELNKLLLEVEALRATAKSAAAPEEGVCLNGKSHKILRVETALELMDLVRKSEVEQDRTVLVIDRHGA
jgi:hypothetical protein